MSTDNPTWRTHISTAITSLRLALKLAPVPLQHPLSVALQMLEAVLLADGRKA